MKGNRGLKPTNEELERLCFEKDKIVGWKSNNVIRSLVRSCQMRDNIVGYDIWLSYLYQLLDLKKSE
jgi:hypothetical protein